MDSKSLCYEILYMVASYKKLTKKNINDLCEEVKEYYAVHWRDDDNPEIECKMRRSWIVIAALILLISFHIGLSTIIFWLNDFNPWE